MLTVGILDGVQWQLEQFGRHAPANCDQLHLLVGYLLHLLLIKTGPRDLSWLLSQVQHSAGTQAAHHFCNVQLFWLQQADDELDLPTPLSMQWQFPIRSACYRYIAAHFDVHLIRVL